MPLAQQTGMTSRTSAAILLAALASACGGAAAPGPHAQPTARDGDAPPATRIAIRADSESVDARRFDRFSSELVNTSAVLAASDRGAMEHLGLDPASEDDCALLAFVQRGFHYRYGARKGGERELGLYVYNIDGVRVGQPIPVLDATALEGIEPDEIGPTLHEIFDEVRAS